MNAHLKCLFALAIPTWDSGRFLYQCFWLGKIDVYYVRVKMPGLLAIFINRSVEGNLLEFSCCLTVDGQFLKDGNYIPYKYYLSSQQPKPFEVLHGAQSSGEIANRCLHVPKENFQIGGKLLSIRTYMGNGHNSYYTMLFQ